MWKYIATFVFGICAFFSFYMAFLAFRIGEIGTFLFLGFGLLFGILFVISAFNVFSKWGEFLKREDEIISGELKPVSFTPHWFLMAALIFTGIAILTAVLVPIFF